MPEKKSLLTTLSEMVFGEQEKAAAFVDPVEEGSKMFVFHQHLNGTEHNTCRLVKFMYKRSEMLQCVLLQATTTATLRGCCRVRLEVPCTAPYAGERGRSAGGETRRALEHHSRRSKTKKRNEARGARDCGQALDCFAKWNKLFCAY